MGLADGTASTNKTRARRYRQPYLGPRVPAVVGVLIAINVGIELTLSLADAGVWFGPWLRQICFLGGAFYPGILEGTPPLFPLQPVTMFVTYAFLHGGIGHLALNMLALYLFGNAIIRRVGTARFLIAYALSAFGGAVGFVLLGDGVTPMVGASGALFGLLGVWSCWDFLDKRFYRARLWETVSPLFYLLLYNLAFMVLLSGQLAWEAHLGGFVTGWVIALYWGRPIYRRVSSRSRSNPNTAELPDRRVQR